MKNRINLSVLFVLLALVSAPAKADFLTNFLVDASVHLVGGVVKGVVNTVKDAVTTKESTEERIARQQAEIERAAEEIASQYPEDQRDEVRSRTIEKLAMTQAQYQAMEARQKAIAAEQNSVGNVIISSTVGAASSALGNRMTIDAAARAASMRTRF